MTLTSRFARIGLMSAATFAAALAAPAVAQQDFSAVEIKTTEVAPGIYMMTGAGGNLGVFTGEDGPLLVDDQYAPLSEKIIAAIAEISDKPVEFLVNTHWHGDHTGGNENFGATGTHIVAHENVRKRLIEGQSGEREVAPAPEAALPVITFSDEVDFYWNGHDIAVRHVAPAHTDGDSVIFVDGAAVVHMGDTFFNGFYPFVDVESGGDLDGYIAAQEMVLAEINDDTIIIPGHGPLSNKAELQATNDMLKSVRAAIQATIDAGMSEDEAVAADPLAATNEQWGKGFINPERMVRLGYRSLTQD